MSKNTKRIILIVIAVLAALGAVFAWYKVKQSKKKEDEFSDIFEEDDFDLDDSL